MLEQSRIVLLDPSDARWVGFAASNPRANIFHHPAWIGVLAESYGYRPFVIAVCDTVGNICAGLPMLEVKSLLTGRRWVSLPFTDHCEPLYTGRESLHELAVGLVRLYQDASAPRIELRSALLTHAAMYRGPQYVLHTLRLDPDADAVASRFHRTHWQNTRTAEERGVRIEIGEELAHLRAFYRLQLDTRRRQGVPAQPWEFFDLLGRKILEQGLGVVLLAYKGDQCVAAGLFMYWQRTLTFKYAASSRDGQNLRPNNLLTWTAIRLGCEKRCTVLDFGRSDLANTGLRRYKKGWGADETPLTYSTVCAKPPKPAGGTLERVMHTAIRNSPVWMCKAAGELLYKHFG